MAAILLVAGLLVLSSPAAAYNQKVRDRTGDARFGDRAGDIRSVVAGHGRGGRLEFRFKVLARDRFNTVHPGVRIRAGGRTYVGNTIGMFDERTGNKVGEINVRKKGKRYTLSFSRAVIGSPNAYLWQAKIDGPDLRIDKAPNSGWARHVLVGSRPPQPKQLKVRKGKAPFTFVCPSTEKQRCKGTLTIVAKIKGRKVNLVEPHRYDVPIGGDKRVKLKLTKAAKRLLKRKRKIVGIGTLTGVSGDVVNFRAILKR